MFALSTAGVCAATVNGDGLLKQYCFQCHNSKLRSGSLALEGLSNENPAGHPDVWEKVVRRLKAGEMPPPKLPRPDAATIREFTSELTARLDAAAESKPYAGKPVIR